MLVLGVGPRGLFGMVIAGQSNALGYASAATLTGGNVVYATPYVPTKELRQGSSNNSDPIVWRYNAAGGTSPPAVLESTQPHLQAGIFPDAMGADLSMARDLNALAANAWSIPVFGVGGSGLELNWLPSAAYPVIPPNLYSQFVTFVQAFRATNTLQAFLWIQGEQDADAQSTAEAYAANMTTFWTAVRSVFPLVPLIVIQLSSAANPVYTTTVRAQQVTFRNSFPWTTLLDCSDLPLADGLHYTADSYITMGQRVVAAYSVAVATTKLAVQLTSSVAPAPVPATTPYSYDVVITNTGLVNAATNVAVVVTLPTGVVYTASSGTGWTFSVSGQVVTCTRASIAAGVAASTITIDVISPSTLAVNPITCVANAVADNMSTVETDSEVTTISVPSVTYDAVSGIGIPQTDAQWSAIALAIPGLSNPKHLYRCQESGSPFRDSIGTADLVANGTDLASIIYNAAIVGWASTGAKFTNGLSMSLRNTLGMPLPQNKSSMYMVYADIQAAPTSTRNLFECFSGATMSLFVTTTPRARPHLGGNATSGSFNPTGPRVYILQYNHTAGTFTFYSDQETFTVTYTAEVGSAFGLGASIGAFAATAVEFYAAVWEDAAAEVSKPIVRSMLQFLAWNPPW